MAMLLRNVMRVNHHALINGALRRAVVGKIVKPVCFLYTSNKKKDAVSVAEKLHDTKIAPIGRLDDKEEVNKPIIFLSLKRRIEPPRELVVRSNRAGCESM
jgi:hypothetical protein